MKVVAFSKPPERSPEKALAILDNLREKVAAGEIVAFVAAGLNAGDESYVWAGACEGVSRLRMMGAIAHLEYSYHGGLVG